VLDQEAGDRIDDSRPVRAGQGEYELAVRVYLACLSHARSVLVSAAVGQVSIA
jgi:hypothetical protein